MKSKTSTTLTALALVAFTIPLMLTCGGCSSSPSCTDGDIQGVVMEIATEQFTSTLTQLGMPDKDIQDKLSTMHLTDVMDMTPKGTPDDQCGCSATLASDGGALPITYTVQTTRDGEYYVEVQGLQ